MPTNMMISRMTAPSTTSSSSTISSNNSEPKLAFSIDSIVGRSSSRSTADCSSERERLSPRVSAHHKSRHSPVSCARSVSPPHVNRLSERSAQVSRQLSPSSRSAANMSPMSTPSPISMANGSASSPYLESGRMNQLTHQSHSSQQSPIGPSQMAHPLMMAAAHHMSPIPQSYHQAAFSQALYPWLLRANPFANRFHGHPMAGLLPMEAGHPQFSGHIHPAAIPAFLSPLFRKPKRIRTAFSPNQLLKLEHAFEKNHYVVGAERKDLARSLNLSETQVKVWFQNRRTKHKRQKDENGEPVDESEGTDEEDDDDEHELKHKERTNTDNGVNGMANNSNNE